MARSLIPISFFDAPTQFSSYFPSFKDLEERMGKMVEQWGSETDINVWEDSTHVYVEANMPGLKQEDIDVSLYQNVLRIKGEQIEEKEEGDKNKRYYRRSRQRSFFYQLSLPTQVEENTESAAYEDGVLKISFRKAKQANVKKIAVSRGNNKQTAKANNKTENQSNSFPKKKTS